MRKPIDISFSNFVDGLVQDASNDIAEIFPLPCDIEVFILTKYENKLLEWILAEYPNWATDCGEEIIFSAEEFNALLNGILHNGRPMPADFRKKAKKQVLSIITDYHDLNWEIQERCLEHGINGNPLFADEHDRDFLASR